MSTPVRELDLDADLLRVARELNNALAEARPYVYNAQSAARADLQPWREETATHLLERVDGALADAGELLQRVTS